MYYGLQRCMAAMGLFCQHKQLPASTKTQHTASEKLQLCDRGVCFGSPACPGTARHNFYPSIAFWLSAEMPFLDTVIFWHQMSPWLHSAEDCHSSNDYTYGQLWCEQRGVLLLYTGIGLLYAPGAPTSALPIPITRVQIPTCPWNRCTCNFGSPCTYSSYF